MDLADQHVERKRLRCENASEESSGKNNSVCENIPKEEENQSGIDKISDELSMAESMLQKKDGAADSLAVKSEENESLIVLDDDIHNDLDADLATNGKKMKLAGGKKCATTNATDGATPAKDQNIEQKKDVKDAKTKSPSSSDDKKIKGKESLNVAEKKEELNSGDTVESPIKVECGDQIIDTNNSSTVNRNPVGQMETKLEDASSKRASTVSSAGQASEKPENKNNNNLNQKTLEENLLVNTLEVINKCFPLQKTAAKSEENESLIVLVDDIHNDLDADLATSEKKSGQANKKKSTTTSTTEVNTAAKSQKDQKTDKKVEQKKDGKDIKAKSSGDTLKTKKGKTKSGKTCNLWITGLNSNTKATNLKALFIKYGWVVAAKVVTTARIPSRCCYGFVTMSSIEEANNCIHHLNQTKFNGTVITVKMARNALGMQIQKKATQPAKKPVNSVTKKESKPAGGVQKSNKDVKKSPQKTEGEKKTAAKSKASTRSKTKQKKKSWSHVLLDPKASKDLLAKAKFEESQRRRKETSRTRSSLRRHHPTEPHPHSHRHYLDSAEPDVPPHLRERRRTSELKRPLPSRRETSYDKETYRLEKAKKELRAEREKLDRARRKLATANDSSMWPKRDRLHSSRSLRYEEERPGKRSFERNQMHGDSFWNDHNLDDNDGSLSLRYRSLFSESSRYSDLKEAHHRRSSPYYRESKNLGSSDHYDVPLGRVGESSSRLHDKYSPSLDSSSRLDLHLNSDKFDRMDTGFRRDSDHIVYESDRRNMLHSRDIDHRSVSAHNRLGRMRNSPDPDWKMDEWSNMSGNMASGGGSRHSDRWISSSMSGNHDHQAGGSSSMNSPGYLGRNSGMGGGSSGGGGMGGTSGLMLNTGPGNVFSYSHHSGMMSGGGGGGGMGGQMRDSHYDESYTNMRRY